MGLKYTTRLGRLDAAKNHLAYRVRRRIFELFMRECAPSSRDRVADFGVSGHRDHAVHYFFETLYPYRERLTAIGREAEGAAWMSREFPGLTFLEADLRKIPLPDDYFAAGICNAVLEHGGTRAEQAALVAEVCRVCTRVMFTTPNKRFPLELHTFLPLLHWLPDGHYRRVLRALGQTYFADIANLNLLDSAAFSALFPEARDNRFFATGLPLLPTNLICVSVKRDRNATATPSR